jgi:hypothetical protein
MREEGTLSSLTNEGVNSTWTAKIATRPSSVISCSSPTHHHFLFMGIRGPSRLTIRGRIYVHLKPLTASTYAASYPQRPLVTPPPSFLETSVAMSTMSSLHLATPTVFHHMVFISPLSAHQFAIFFLSELLERRERTFEEM